MVDQESEKKKETKKIESLFKNKETSTQVETILKTFRKGEIQEVRAKLNSYLNGNKNILTAKLTDGDVETFLKMLEDEEKRRGLYKTNELRPLPFSKTITIFDVYETDEEHFEPYISPLATVGAVSTSSTPQSTEEITGMEDIGLSGSEKTGQESEENKGLFGFGIAGL